MSAITMEALFVRAGLDYKTMEPFKFYDVSEKGLKIKSYNYERDLIENRLITALVYKGQEPKYQLISQNGEVLLESAGAHEVFDNDLNEYVSVAEFGSSHIRIDTGDVIQARAVRTDDVIPVLDMAVDGTFCYFTNGVLSHNSMYGSPFAATGGNAVKYFASIRNRITKIDVLKDGKDEVGIQIKVRNLKNKTSTPWREAIMNLYFDGGFDTESEYVDFLSQLGVIQQKGAYFYLPGQEKGVQGKEKLIEWLKANPAQYDVWKQEILERLSGKLESDATLVDPEAEALPTRGSAEANIQDLAQAALGGVEEEAPPDLGLDGE